MLHEVVLYARQQCPQSEPGFASKEVQWAISLTGDGRLLGVLELGDPCASRKRGMTFPKAPNLLQPELIGGGKTRSHFLIETVDVVTGFGEQPERAEKNQLKRDFFLSLLDQASGCVPQLAAASALLRDPDAIGAIRDRLAELKAKPSDKITLCIDGEFPAASSAWHDWWRRFRAGLNGPSASGAAMLCLITGEPVQPAATHPKIRGLPGASPTGASLISFDKDAFQSYGLAQSANAAMSEEVAKAYESGLDHLIQNSSVRLGDALVVHWFRSKVEADDDPLNWLEDPPGAAEAAAQSRARELLQAIREGRKPDLAGNTFYAFTLSGNAGRAVVRDWMEGAFTELAAAVGQWFNDLAIVGLDGALAGPFRFSRLLGSLVREPRPDEPRQYPPAPLAAKLFRSAVCAEPIPQAAFAQALARARINFLQDHAPSPACMGLIRAFLLRNRNSSKGGQSMTETIQPGLNENLASPAYQCGRLMAVLADLQQAALVDVGAGIIQRYYAAASATPALVFGRLIRGAQFHLDKLDRGLARWYEDRIADICTRIGSSMPATLTLEEQGLFALGYYQQLAVLRKPKDKLKEANNQEEDIPMEEKQ